MTHTLVLFKKYKSDMAFPVRNKCLITYLGHLLDFQSTRPQIRSYICYNFKKKFSWRRCKEKGASYTLGRNVNCSATMEISMEVP